MSFYRNFGERDQNFVVEPHSVGNVPLLASNLRAISELNRNIIITIPFDAIGSLRTPTYWDIGQHKNLPTYLHRRVGHRLIEQSWSVRYRTNGNPIFVVGSIESVTRTDEAMNEHENAPRFRSGNVVHIGRATITNAETTELRRLFDQVADTCDAANQVLGRSGPPPIGPELDRLRELSARADAMVERLKSILD